LGLDGTEEEAAGVGAGGAASKLYSIAGDGGVAGGAFRIFD
jgi:hypothetical protein